MTREEAVYMLVTNYPNSCYGLLREAVDMAIEALEQPERKKGKWIDIDAETYTWMIKCDKCGHLRSMMSTNGIYPKFCENCGAQMGVGE